MDEIVTPDELQILLNLADEVRISYPLYRGDLLAALPEGARYRIEMTASREDYHAWLLQFGEIADELPSYSDLLECMLASGIIRYANQEAFDEMLQTYRRLKKDVYFGLDTNVLYHRFVSTNPHISPSSCILVNTVSDEIAFAVNRRYSAQKIAEITAYAPEQAAIIGELENKRTKKSRKAAYLAMREYRAIRDRAIEITAPAAHSHRREENDLTIVRALRAFEDERYALPVLLTADTYMADICDAEGLEYFLFERPYEIRVTSCRAGEFVRLLFNLAAVFGVVRCNDVHIFGEYGGKGSSLEDLKLRFSGGGLHEAFGRELKICRRLTALGIER